MSTTFPNVQLPQYELRGYTSMLQGDASKHGTERQKTLTKIALHTTADIQTEQGFLHGAVGYGMQADCLAWDEAEPVPLECLDEGEEEEMRPGLTPKFNFFRSGAFLAWRIWVDGVGNQFCATSATIHMRPKEGCW